MNWGDALWLELHRLARDEHCPRVKSLFGKVFKKAELVYMAQQKTRLAPRLIRQLVANGRKVLVFFERIVSAESVGEDTPRQMAITAERDLADGDRIECFIYHSELSEVERARVLDNFREAGPSALLACRALNEGLDVPTVDAAIIVASTQSQRAMIQRIGRTLRQNASKQRPLITILHARGTNDDNVRVGVDDSYFAGPARIFDTGPNEWYDVINTLSRTGDPPVRWRCIYNRDENVEDLVPRLGELANGSPVRLERSGKPVVEGVVEGVTRKPPRVVINDQNYSISDIVRVSVREVNTRD
jgi:superfamily II DNA or RNA helicase